MASGLDNHTGMKWFAVIDGAQDPRLLSLVQKCARHVCLISGELHPDLAPALPWLVELRADENLMPVWKRDGAGRNWGVALLSSLDIQHVKFHLKKFLNARLPDGTLAMFRFYDPRVMRTYFSAATPEEIAPWFRGVERFSVESAQPGLYHDFHLRGGQIHDGERALAGAMA